MLATEIATTHGYANVTVKGYAKQRQREYRKLGRQPAEQTGKANLSGWQQLQALTEQIAPSQVQHGGERFVGV